MSISCCIMAFNRSIATELFQKVANLHSQEFKFKPSEYQQALIDFIMAGSGNGIVQAVAGSGKTTTIMQGLNEIRKHMELTNQRLMQLQKPYNLERFIFALEQHMVFVMQVPRVMNGKIAKEKNRKGIKYMQER